MAIYQLGAGRTMDTATGKVTYGVYNDPQTAINEMVAPTVEEAPAAPSGPAPYAGVTAGNPRALYGQMGGKKGTKMDFKEFKNWYKQQSETAGMDLSEFITTSELDVRQKGQKAQYGTEANLTAGSDIRDFLYASSLNPAGELHVLNRQLGTNYSTMEDAMNAMALPAGFAGISQWNQNVLGQGGENLPPHLRNVSMQDIRYEPHAWNLAYNAMLEAKDPKKRLEAQQELVPEWAAAVDEALRGQLDPTRQTEEGGEVRGIPFGFQLLADPTINLTDPNKPLWEGGNYPESLSALTQRQAGEGAFIKGLSPAEIMQELWPLVYAQHHRPAGAAAPFEAGLSFGSPVWGGGGYTRSPLMGMSDIHIPDPELTRMEGFAGQEVPMTTLTGPQGLAGGLYNRWQAHGMPGSLDYNPRWGGTLYGQNPDLTPEDWSIAGEGVNDPRLLQLIERYEQEYWQDPLYQPWRQLPEEVRQRFASLIGSPVGMGGETTLTAGYV